MTGGDPMGRGGEVGVVRRGGSGDRRTLTVLIMANQWGRGLNTSALHSMFRSGVPAFTQMITMR